ncbi:tRNA pseudouridine(13) synthase TruD [Candidatus Woesearchaeota archaeon]|nr:tRNA pseudouridine(13) synthase TruD [Candidatus Woesearchaeota archaeon]MBW3006125.1 tRNA pseudouridine(13) synthase TruD [Candidatus Woesearchaeota archaeon]
MYRIKEKPEDFIVKEISIIKPEEKGKYTYFLLKKKNYNTIRAIEHVANALHINPKKFGFAGNKDKIAITEQTCSVPEVSKDRLEKVELRDIELKFLGKGREPISLGDLEGNKFEIIVRNIEKKPEAKKEFINYFGEQRFGKSNVPIGKAIIQKDFEKAVKLMLSNKGPEEIKVRDYNHKNPTNYVGALKTLPMKVLKIYIHAYQSWIWNKVVEKTKKKGTLPLVGFGTIVDDSTLADFLAEEGIEPRDFIIKEIPELSSEGDERETIAEAKDLKIGKLEEDELNKGKLEPRVPNSRNKVSCKKKVKISFTLPPGSYATEFIKQSFT